MDDPQKHPRKRNQTSRLHIVWLRSHKTSGKGKSGETENRSVTTGGWRGGKWPQTNASGLWRTVGAHWVYWKSLTCPQKMSVLKGTQRKGHPVLSRTRRKPWLPVTELELKLHCVTQRGGWVRVPAEGTLSNVSTTHAQCKEQNKQSSVIMYVCFQGNLTFCRIPLSK